MVFGQFVSNPYKELIMDFTFFAAYVADVLWYALIALIVILSLMAATYHALDAWFLPKHRLRGRVDFRQHYPGVLDPVHELYTPETDKVRPDRWYVFVSANAESWPIPIDAKGFQSVRPGDPVMIELSYGRLTRKRYGVKVISHGSGRSIS